MSLSKLRSSSTMEIATSVNYPWPFPPGFTFSPTEAELITFLKEKARNESFEDPTNRFQEIELYNFSPEQLREKYGEQKEREMYIFVKKIPKQRSGPRQRRTTSNGYWHNRDRTNITSENQVVGQRRNFVYCIGRGKARTTTKWLMQEYRLPDQLDKWTLCKVYLNGQEEIMTRARVPRPSSAPVTAEQSTAAITSSNDDIDWPGLNLPPIVDLACLND